MSDGSKMKLKAKRGPGGAIHLSVQSKDDEAKKVKPPRGPGWRAKVRELEQKRKKEAQEVREQRKRGRRRDRGNVRGRGR